MAIVANRLLIKKKKSYESLHCMSDFSASRKCPQQGTRFWDMGSGQNNFNLSFSGTERPWLWLADSREFTFCWYNLMPALVGLNTFSMHSLHDVTGRKDRVTPAAEHAWRPVEKLLFWIESLAYVVLRFKRLKLTAEGFQPGQTPVVGACMEGLCHHISGTGGMNTQPFWFMV